MQLANSLVMRLIPKRAFKVFGATLLLLVGVVLPSVLFAQPKAQGIEDLLKDDGLNLRRGRKIGEGSWKNAFTVKGNRHLVLLQYKEWQNYDVLDNNDSRHWSNQPELKWELGLLSKLQNAKVPTPRFHESIIEVDGIPSMVMERFGYSSKTQTPQFLRMLNEKSLESLDTINKNFNR